MLCNKYFEAQVYEHLQQRPKFFTPILLYHSYNEKDWHFSEKTCQNLLNCQRNNLDSCQLELSEQTFQATDNSVSDILETSLPIADINTQRKDVGSVRSHQDNKFHDINHYSHSDVDSVFNIKQSQRISITPNLVQSQNLNSEYHKSAFTKPRRCQEREVHSSNIGIQGTNTRVSLLNTDQYRFEHSAKDIIQSYRYDLSNSLVDYPNDIDSETVSKTQIRSLSCSESQSIFPSSHPDLCMCSNYLLDWGRHIYSFNPFGTYQTPVLSQVCSNFYSRTFDFSLPVSGTNLVNSQSPLSVSGKNLEYGEVHQEHIISHMYDSSSCSSFTLKPQPNLHSVEKLHKCECGRQFTRKEELTRHKRIHSGHKPFCCSICGKTFGRKDHLNKHRTTHLHTSDKKVHVCITEGCLQRYTRSDALARHQWTAHGIRTRASKFRPYL